MKQEERTRIAQEKLIEAAATLFSQKPVDKVGIREIAKAAGVTTGTFYHHFKTKDDLLVILYRGRDEAFGRIFEKLCEEQGPYVPKVIDFFADILAKRVEDDGIDFTMHRMFTMKTHSDEGNELYKGMIALLKKAQENGEIGDSYDIIELNKYLFMVFRGVIYDWCIAKEDTRPNLIELEKAAMECAIRAFK